MANIKPKVAFFDFACCEGCQLQIANIGEELLDLLGVIDVVEFREVMSEKWDKDYDVVFIEGSITTPHAVERIKKIRVRTKILVAYGSCAAIGGVNGMKNNLDLDKAREYVYPKNSQHFPTIPTMPVDQVVKVDYYVYGCPIYPPEFLKIVKAILAGLPYKVPNKAVCVECKLNENVCLYEKGVICLGPITKGGCNSWCPNNGNICYGCRGLLDDPNMNGQKDVMEKYGITMDMLKNKINMYNSCLELDKYEKKCQN